MIQNYYLPYIEYEIPKERKDYNFYLRLYQQAEYCEDTETYSIIKYNNERELAERINTSKSTLDRKLNDKRYNDLFTVDKKNKIITLNNNYRKNKENNKSKVILLNCNEVEFLLNENDNLLTKYYLYIKYNCIRIQEYNKYNNTNKIQDFTAKQFFTATGYSYNSKEQENKLCKFRQKLADNNFIAIQLYRDQKGYKRCVYTLLDKTIKIDTNKD